jgi:hypothetical protein
MISINDEPDKLIYGRVYLYDEQTKTLIMKVIDSTLYSQKKEEIIVGMGIYNSANITFKGNDPSAKEIPIDM